jgi:hypothetical protein
MTKKIPLYLTCLVLLFIIGRFLFFTWTYSVNIPYFDDFQTFSILVDCKENPNNILPILFQNFNGHRFAMVFGLMWFDTVLEGHYQLTTLMLVGALFYIGVYLVMARLMVKLGVVALVHYSYCTLIVSAYDSSILAMADQHPPIHGVFVIE